MTAIFSIDIAQEPQYLDFLDASAGYGSLSIPVSNLFDGDIVDAVYLTITGTGLTTIQKSIDMVQRTDGYFEWTSQSAISAHFSMSVAETAAIAAATSCTYSAQLQVTRSGSSYTREVQSGNINVRPAIPTPPLIVASIVISGGPVTGGIGSTTQLSAISYDSHGNIVNGVTVAWSSQDPTIATVSSTGLVTIIGLGGTVIEASTYGVFATTVANGTVTPFGVGSLLYAQSVSAMGFLPIGTPGQFLEVNGGATAPTWHTITAADVGAGVFKTGAFTFGGNVLFGTDNAFDIGATGVTRPRDLYLGRNLIVGGTTAFGGLTYTWPGSQSANKVLKTDGAGALSWSTPTEEIALTDLTDVAISAATEGQVLRYTSGAWINSFDASLLTAMNATQLTTGTVANARLAGGYTGITAIGTLAADLLFTDATYDIGKSGATRPRDLFMSRNLTVGGTIALTTAVGKVIPGGTSLSLRNNADTFDNVLIADSGAVTFRSTVGGITTLTATTLGGTLSTAAQPNVTSLGTLAANLLFVDANYDVGQSGATRPRHGYFSGNVTAGSSFIGALQKTLTFGTHLTGSSFNNAGDVTIATDAVSTNTASTIVSRDGSGNFAAGTITASLTGASSLNLLLTGGTLTGALLFTDASFDIGASGLTRPRSGFFSSNVTVGGTFIGSLASTLTFGTHLASGGSSFNNSAGVTISTDATNANTASTIVARDGSGNFTAGTITASLTGHASLDLPITGGTLTGNLLFTDATYDIGASGATRPRSGFFSSNVTAGGTFIGALANSLTPGTHLAGGAFNNAGAVTFTTDATDANTVSTIVARDGSGNFSAGTISASITGHASLDLALTGGTMGGDLLFTDALYDIGKSGLTRPRDGFFSRNLVVGVLATIGGLATFNGGATVASGQTLTLTGSTVTGAPTWGSSQAITLSTASQPNITTASALVTVGALASGSIAAGFGGGRFGGNVIANVDATYDIGASGATRFRDLFLSRNATIGGVVTIGSSTGNQVLITQGADGNIQQGMKNAAGTTIWGTYSGGSSWNLYDFVAGGAALSIQVGGAITTGRKFEADKGFSSAAAGSTVVADNTWTALFTPDTPTQRGTIIVSACVDSYTSAYSATLILGVNGSGIVSLQALTGAGGNIDLRVNGTGVEVRVVHGGSSTVAWSYAILAAE